MNMATIRFFEFDSLATGYPKIASAHEPGEEKRRYRRATPATRAAWDLYTNEHGNDSVI